MKGPRMERVAEQLRQVLSEILLYRVNDPGAQSAVITRVDVSRDLAHARVHVSVLGTSKDRELAVQALDRASSFIRSELAREVRMRKVPELRFQPDAGMEHSERIQESLRELGLDSGGSSGEDETPSVDPELSAGSADDDVSRGLE